MNKLPPALDGLASSLDAQPGKVRDIYLYGFYLMMVEAGWMGIDGRVLFGGLKSEYYPLWIQIRNDP